MQSEVERRGVYWARYTKKGRPICYAVDSTGEVVRRYVVTHDSKCASALEALWNYLDVVDPVAAKPKLQLVRDEPARALPSTQRRATPEDFDPYNLPPLPRVRRF